MVQIQTGLNWFWITNWTTVQF